MENCVFEVDIPLNFTLCFMNLVILNEYHLILRTMNEIKETWEVVMQHRGLCSPPIKPVLLFFFWCFYNILFLKSHSYKRLQNAQIASWEVQLCFLICLSFESSVGDCSTLRVLAVSLQGGGGSFGTAALLLPRAFPGIPRAGQESPPLAEMRECSIQKVPAAPDDFCCGNRTRM